MKKVRYTNMEDVMFGVLIVAIITLGYVLLNQNYLKGVEDCSKSYDVDYCKTVMSK